MGFPEKFLWGTATASYQVEGGFEDGRGYTVWDDFCAIPGKVLDGSDGSMACDHYHRYKEDVALMKELGFKAYRFSIAWSRILPEGTGEVSEAGLQFYENLVDELCANDIIPCVTLFHCDLPYALYRRGGWQNPDSPEWFAEYTRVVAERLGKKVPYFITFNEPQCFIGLGHVTGEHAPGNLMSRKSVLEMTHHVLMAHGKAVKVLRDYAPEAKVGIAPTSTVACPATEKPEDVEAARKAYFDVIDQENYMWSVSWWSDPVFFGKYPEEGVKLFAGDMPCIGEQDMELISQPVDFYGQNIYNGYPVASDGKGGYSCLPRKRGASRTACGWPVVPESLYWGPKFLYERYHKPIFITENGISCTDSICLDGKVHDAERIDFLHRYLLALKKCVEEGNEVEAYFVWSLMDNFEWAKGYTERFGLIHVDYETQVRTMKDSAWWFKKMMESNGNDL